ncbi:hypothetical protein FRC08_018637 [Ceratobasidium sp. 394]|nr:hypothetical protein FRC08_018637 [Ceratobasidium sp. 394]
MSAQQKRKRSGPVGRSCLTCRARSKKCDKSRPACERCIVGGFDCLGYDHPEEGPRDSDVRRSTRLDAGPLDGVHQGQPLQFVLLTERDYRVVPEETRTATSPQHDEQAVFLTAVGSNASIPGSSSGALDTTISDGPSRLSWSTLSTPFASLAPRQSATHSHSSSDWLPFPSDVRYPPNTGTPYYNFALPQSISPIPTQTREVLTFALSCYEQLVRTSFFQPAYDQLMRVRESLSWRLQVSPAARWSLFIGAKVFQSMVDPPQVRAAKFTKYHDWIKRLEEKMDAIPLIGLTPAEVRDHLGERLDVMLFKLRTTSSLNTYQILRNQAPTFLQIAFSDSTLRPSTHYSSNVSLAHVLASTRYETTHFALLDMMCSMAYGLPSVIDYDTSVPSLGADFHPVEWVHGCPVGLQMIIVKINSLCHWNQIGPAPDWRCIEQELRDWRPCVCKFPEEESWRVVARLAVRESWRHTLLIYLYMSVCGARSDDPRVSLSVRQVFQIIDTVKHKPQPITRLHFSTQYLMAGAYTPSEKQRAIAREQLSVSVKTGTWLLSGSDFIPVLDHLWHGAAAGGRPVTWNDYLHSRQVALPIPI